MSKPVCTAPKEGHLRGSQAERRCPACGPSTPPRGSLLGAPGPLSTGHQDASEDRAELARDASAALRARISGGDATPGEVHDALRHTDPGMRRLALSHPSARDAPGFRAVLEREAAPLVDRVESLAEVDPDWAKAAMESMTTSANPLYRRVADRYLARIG